MTIGQDVADATPEHRVQAESMMTALLVIRQPPSLGIVDGKEQQVPGATLYDGKGRVRAARLGETVPAGGQQTTGQQYRGFTPWDSPTPWPGCTVEITSSPSGRMDGWVLTVTSAELHEPAIHTKFALTHNQG